MSIKGLILVIWQRYRFLRLLKCCAIQENSVPIIPPQKQSWMEILPFISYQEIKEISILSLGRMGLVSAAAHSSHFLHYRETKRDANLEYFHFSAQYQALSLSKFLIQSWIWVSFRNEPETQHWRYQSASGHLHFCSILGLMLLPVRNKSLNLRCSQKCFT